LSAFDDEYDRMISDIEELQTSTIRNEPIKLHLILSVEEARWVSSRIYEDVERGIFTAEFQIKQSAHSLDMGIALGVVVGAAVTTIVQRSTNYLLDELKDFLTRKKKRRIRTKEKNRKMS